AVDACRRDPPEADRDDVARREPVGEHDERDEQHRERGERLHAAYSTDGMETASRSTDFVALGHPGSGHYAGLETFANPGVALVELESDELTAVCPVTGQPDMYVATIEYEPDALCLESKSVKLYLNRFRDEGHFCEALAV